MAKHEAGQQHIGLSATEELEDLWFGHNAAWRSTAQIASQWQDATCVNPRLLQYKVRGKWWQVLEEQQITLVISREYEHLLLAVSVANERPTVSYLPMPHPSGLAADRKRGVMYVASTRNPNQIYDLVPVNNLVERLDVKAEPLRDKPLIPLRSRFLPGCLYMHDLALIGGKLYANAVGHNAVVVVHADGNYERVWWPRCIETTRGPMFGQNFIQLNSIAAGSSLKNSFFSASSDRISRRRPGHKNYPVDKRGVIFSAITREAIAWGLTRPHSARLFAEKIWVDDSGYGEFGFIEHGKFQSVTKLPGWTRGLVFSNSLAFVGTSRVIPKFAQYAPGLDVGASICGIHAINVQSGEVLGSIIWPYGNQIFAIDWFPTTMTYGLPFSVIRTSLREEVDRKTLFYTFSLRSLPSIIDTNLEGE